MRIAVTGASGFVGRHFAGSLADQGHTVVALARGHDRRDPDALRHPGIHVVHADVGSGAGLREAFADCEAVAHLAGINLERGSQTYQRVHVHGTRRVVEAARAAGVQRLALLSFLRARPSCGSAYHESKWAAEEIVRASVLDYTVLKAGVIYGPGDHMLDHLARALRTFPLFALVGLQPRPVRPVAVADVVRVLQAALVEGRLPRRTVAVVGPEELLLEDVVRRVAAVIRKRPLMLRLPVAFHYALAAVLERVMPIPLVARAQVRILAEGVAEPAGPVDDLPGDLAPRALLDAERIARGVPDGAFGLHDCRWPFAALRRAPVGANQKVL